MKIQNLALIFAIIIIPVSLVLGYYVRSEIDTLELQSSYDEKLITATYDAIKAYQINTAKNDNSIQNRSRRRDVEAAINTFMTSFATGLGVGGYGENYIKPYVPAILFTLYDGYYIYAPTLNNAKNPPSYEHILKPFVTYTQRYVKGNIDVYVSYTLDNYITVTGTLSDGSYVSRSGYLVNDNYTASEENLQERLLFYDTNTGEATYGTYQYVYQGGEKKYYDPYTTSPQGWNWFLYRNGQKVYINVQNSTGTNDRNAVDYVTNAREFTDWVYDKLRDITIGDLILNTGIEQRNRDSIYNYGGNAKIFNKFENIFEDESSTFNTHRRDMIRISIKENLSSAITGYNEHAGTTGEFLLPTLKEVEWEQITKNICAVSFVQGLPVGFKTYNSYAIINNTRNENYIDKDSIVFIDLDADLNDPVATCYHMIDCPKLNDTGRLIGYRKIDFETVAVEVIERNASGESSRQTKYYFKHTNLPCYYCIVSRNYTAVNVTGSRLQALRQALGRERQLLHY